MKEMKEKVFAYIQDQYNVKPEFPWKRCPGYAAFRHIDNRKMFAMVTDRPEKGMGLGGDSLTAVLNVKVSDPFLADVLIQQEGFFRGHPFGRGHNWIAILLDGTVALEEICQWLDESYMATASRETRQRLRPPKEWIIPANPVYYDVQKAFTEADEIDWKQGKGIKAGDTVFMYVAAPVSAILYQCLVTEAEIPYRFDDGRVHMSGVMRIKLLKCYDPGRFTFEVLGKEYGIHAVRGPRGIPDSLSEALKREK